MQRASRNPIRIFQCWIVFVVLVCLRCFWFNIRYVQDKSNFIPLKNSIFISKSKQNLFSSQTHTFRKETAQGINWEN